MRGGIDVLIDFMVALKYVLVNPIKFWKKKYGMREMMIQYSMGDWKPLWRKFVHTKRKARVRTTKRNPSTSFTARKVPLQTPRSSPSDIFIVCAVEYPRSLNSDKTPTKPIPAPTNPQSAVPIYLRIKKSPM